MSTVLIFESFDPPDSVIRDWKLKSVLTGPVNNGFMWNQVQPLFNADVQAGDCANFVLIVEDTFEEDNSRQTTRAQEFSIVPDSIKFCAPSGGRIGR